MSNIFRFLKVSEFVRLDFKMTFDTFRCLKDKLLFLLNFNYKTRTNESNKGETI